VPTDHHRHAVSPDEAWTRAGQRAFPAQSSVDRPDRIGLEPEIFPIFRSADGSPAGRVPLHDPSAPGVLDVLDVMVCREAEFGTRRGGPLGPWEYLMANGGRLTFEPGAQVEHSTGVYPNVAEAIADVQRVLGCLREAFAVHGVVLAAAGMDIWHDVATVPQQLPFGRYTAQAAYYDRRGSWGRVMMRHTASLQINLDLGPVDVWQERWLAANLITPLITATFACSPGEGGVSTRARAWQELDPTRSGFPSAFVDRTLENPRDQWARSAMDADVMLFKTDDGRWEPGDPGFTFERWVREGHPEHGWPTVEDLEYHLTTLFFEVRPRGFLELRGGEQVPDCWRAAQVVLITATIYDDSARRAVVERMDPLRERLADLWRTAARVGVADIELQELSMAAWEAALAGVDRLGRHHFGEAGVDCARRFLKEFTSVGRTPADRLRELHQDGSALSLAWAASSQL
jgi:glutamate--cysteine ligase